MNEEILKLAKKCVMFECSAKWYVGIEDELEEFYRAAFNAGIESAANQCYRVEGMASDYVANYAQAIRALKGEK